MKRPTSALIITLGTIVVVTFLACAGLLFSQTATFPKPAAITNSVSGGQTCASARCNYSSSFDYQGSYDDLTSFYQEKGYTCELGTEGEKSELFGLTGPYQLCKGHGFPESTIIVGFQKLQVASSKGDVHVYVYVIWKPIL